MIINGPEIPENFIPVQKEALWGDVCQKMIRNDMAWVMKNLEIQLEFLDMPVQFIWTFFVANHSDELNPTAFIFLGPCNQIGSVSIGDRAFEIQKNNDDSFGILLCVERPFLTPGVLESHRSHDFVQTQEGGQIFILVFRGALGLYRIGQNAKKNKQKPVRKN